MNGVFRCRLLLATAAMLAAGPAARAQDFEHVVVEFEDILVKDVEDAAVADMNIVADPNNFDQWVFGGGSMTLAKGRKRLNSMLTLQVESADRVCSLSEAQKAKLELAGRGDIERFFDEVDAARREFMKNRRDEQKMNQIWEKLSPLQEKLQSGIFDDRSLVHKLLKRTLDPQQQAKYEQSELKRRRFRYKAKVAVVVAMLEKGMPLRDEQRQKFLKLIVEETDPPRRFGQYDYYVVLYQVSKLPDDKVKPIFDERNGALQAQVQQGKGMEQMLRQEKIIP